MAKHFAAWFFCTLLPVLSIAQTAKYSNEFLSIGIGAKSFGMANATVAHIDDVTSGYWNPAGLSGMSSDYELGAMHAEYFTGIAKYDYLAAAWSLDTTQHLAASIIRFGVDNIPNTTELIDKQGNIDYERLSYFSAADYAMILSYARSAGIPNLSYGGNVKIIHRRIGKFASSWGFGFDLAVQYEHNNWHWGGILRDVTTTFNAWNFNEKALIIEAGDSIFNDAPDNNLELTMPTLVLGAAYSFPVAEKLMALFETNLDIHTDGKRHSLISSDPFSIDPHAGIEFQYHNLIFFRMGVGNFQRIQDIQRQRQTSYQPNLGIGVHYKGFAIDYALTDIGDQSTALYSNIFTLRYAFNKGE